MELALGRNHSTEFQSGICSASARGAVISQSMLTDLPCMQWDRHPEKVFAVVIGASVRLSWCCAMGEQQILACHILEATVNKQVSPLLEYSGDEKCEGV